MQHISRFRAAGRAALLHLGVSAFVAALVAALVFKVWYPDGLDRLTGGAELFLLLIAVDMICGPVLTLLLFSPSKARWKWRLDLTLIVIIQCSALFYGLSQVALARPVFVAFEGDRFRLVQAFDVPEDGLEQAPPDLRNLSLKGPAMLGVRLAKPTDSDFPLSVQMSIQGLHPAFRPSRWVPYADQRDQLLSSLKDVEALKKNPVQIERLRSTLAERGLTEEQVGYLPLVREMTTNWSALVNRADARIVAYLPMDGW